MNQLNSYSKRLMHVPRRDAVHLMFRRKICRITLKVSTSRWRENVKNVEPYSSQIVDWINVNQPVWKVGNIPCAPTIHPSKTT